MLSILASSLPNTTVNVLSLFQDEAERWSKANAAKPTRVVRTADGSVVESKLNHITNDPSIVIPTSDVITFVMPSFAHAQYFEAIRPYIGTKNLGGEVAIGSMPAEGGFDIQARALLGDDIFDNVILFGLETLPWACRLKEFGSEVEVLGTKKEVDIAVSSHCPEREGEVISTLQSLVGPLPELKRIPNILNCTLMNINSVWHPCITTGRYRDWDFKTPFDEPPLFYEGVDSYTANLLTEVSNEVLKLRDTIEKEYPSVDLHAVVHVKEWMYRSYHGDIEDEHDLEHMITTNKGYHGLTHPTVKTEEGKYMPNWKYRYCSEDIPYGLLVTRGIAELFDTPMPQTDFVIEFLQKPMGKEYIVGGKVCGKDIKDSRCPQKYGIKTKDEFMRWCGYLPPEHL